jgi:uncharacterized membrane protein
MYFNVQIGMQRWNAKDIQGIRLPILIKQETEEKRKLVELVEIIIIIIIIIVAIIIKSNLSVIAVCN